MHFGPTPVVRGTVIGIVCVFGAFLMASGVAIVRRFYLIGTIIAGLARIGILRGRLRPDMTWINRMEDLLLIVLRDSPARLVRITLLEIGAQAFLVIELFLLLRALDMMAPAVFAFVIEASVKVIGIAFLFIPLQLGVSEGAYALIFDTMGLPAAAGFALAFLRRARMLTIAGVGLTTLAVLTRHRHHTAA